MACQEPEGPACPRRETRRRGGRRCDRIGVKTTAVPYRCALKLCGPHERSAAALILAVVLAELVDAAGSRRSFALYSSQWRATYRRQYGRRHCLQRDLRPWGGRLNLGNTSVAPGSVSESPHNCF